MYKIEEIINKILCGDCLTELKKMPSKSVDMVITSPPYYGLRNYGVDGQIGLEKTFDEYKTKILEITAELKRVLKKSGQLWWNMGDIYGTHQSGGKNSVHNFRKPELAVKVGHSIKKGDSGQEKCLLMMPERIALEMIDNQGWILRNKIKWAKQILLKKENITKGSVMPTSVKDRFNESGEELYFFVKNKKYYSDLDSVRMKNQVLGVPDFREDTHHLGSGFVRTPELYPNSKYRGKFRGNENAETFNSPRARTQRKSLDERLNDPRGNHKGGPGSWRDFKDAHPYRNKTIIDPNARGLRQSPQPGEPNAFHPLGKNLPSVWLIGSEPHNFRKELDGIDTDHFAIFPEALLDIPIRFGCPSGGIVLDCFGGAGTTAIVAKKLNRNYILIELSKKYCELAEKRIKLECPQTLF